MISIIIVILALAVIAANVGVYRSRHSVKSRYDYNRMTPTGETFGERKSYHDRGELSPGELAAAHAIRDHLASQKKNDEDV